MCGNQFILLLDIHKEISGDSNFARFQIQRNFHFLFFLPNNKKICRFSPFDIHKYTSFHFFCQ
nr:MAG TPA: hypothetical protein [Caudoviricetes sp.]